VIKTVLGYDIEPGVSEEEYERWRKLIAEQKLRVE